MGFQYKNQYIINYGFSISKVVLSFSVAAAFWVRRRLTNFGEWGLVRGACEGFTSKRRKWGTGLAWWTVCRRSCATSSAVRRASSSCWRLLSSSSSSSFCLRIKSYFCLSCIRASEWRLNGLGSRGALADFAGMNGAFRRTAGERALNLSAGASSSTGLERWKRN